MRILKNLMKSDGFHRFACSLIAGYIRLVYFTGRWTHENFEIRDRYCASGQPFMIALWHNRVAMMPYAWRHDRHTLNILASGHRDGMIVNRTMSHFGVETIAGSSLRGGVSAVKKIVQKMKRENAMVGITPDGPRGPRGRVKEGVAVMSRLADAPVLTVAYSCRNRIVINSWDRFIVPLPFTRGIIRWGEIVPPPASGDAADIEQTRAAIEEAVRTLTDGCDRDMGHEPIPPAPHDEDPDSRKRNAHSGKGAA